MSAADYDSTADTQEHIARVGELLVAVELQLAQRSLEHDASKLAEPEKSAFDRCTPMLKATSSAGGPGYDAAKAELGDALAHHYEHNRHHPEHHEDGIHGMNLLDLIEMLADWKAAGERHADGGNIMASIENFQSRFGYGVELRRLLENTVRDLGWL